MLLSNFFFGNQHNSVNSVQVWLVLSFCLALFVCAQQVFELTYFINWALKVCVLITINSAYHVPNSMELLKHKKSEAQQHTSQNTISHVQLVTGILFIFT